MFTLIAQKDLSSRFSDLFQKFEEMKKKYFISLVVSVKLQGSILGWYCNTDQNLLYEEILNSEQDVNKWPEWVNDQIKKRSERPPKTEV